MSSARFEVDSSLEWQEHAFGKLTLRERRQVLTIVDNERRTQKKYNHHQLSQQVFVPKQYHHSHHRHSLMDNDSLFEAYTLTPSQITSSSDSLFSGSGGNEDQQKPAMTSIGHQLVGGKAVSQQQQQQQEDGIVVIEEPSIPKLAKIANELIRAQSEKKRPSVVPPLPIPPAAVVIEKASTTDLSNAAVVEHQQSLSTTASSFLPEASKEIDTSKDQSESINNNILDDSNNNRYYDQSDHHQHEDTPDLEGLPMNPNIENSSSSHPNTPKMDMSLHLSALSSPPKPISGGGPMKTGDPNLHHLKEPTYSSSPPRRPASASSTRSTSSQNPNYMNSTITWSSKESNKSIADLKGRFSQKTLRLEINDYHY